MEGKAFLIRLRPGHQETYKERHRAVWPELVETIKRHGFRNYSIFMNGDQLFAYMEHEGNFDRAFREMHRDPVSVRWREFMSDIVIRDENLGFQFLERVFRLE